jgi:hypothetical protein
MRVRFELPQSRERRVLYYTIEAGLGGFLVFSPIAR